MKTYKGEKYIYLLAGYTLATQEENKRASIGNDNGIKGGQNYWRAFEVQEYKGKTLLIEIKTSAHNANFSRVFEVVGILPKPIIRDYINESGENEGQRWVH